MLKTIYIHKLTDVPRIWKQRWKFTLCILSPIENHYKEKFDVSGLLEISGHVLSGKQSYEKELLNHNLFIIEIILVCYVRTVFYVCFIHTVIFVYYNCNKKMYMKRPNSV